MLISLIQTIVSSGKASDTLEVAVTTIALDKDFIHDPVLPGGTVTVDFIITNRDRNDSATGVAFTDDLAAGLADLTFDSLISNNCGGTVTGVGTTDIGLAGGTLAAGASCTISASLSVPAEATPGAYTNATGAITATLGSSPMVGDMASDILSITGAPTFTKEFLDNPVGGGTTTFDRVTVFEAPPSEVTVDFPAEGATIELLLDGDEIVARIAGGAELLRTPADSVPSLAFSGGDSDDLLIVDFSGGNPLPTGAVQFAGNLGDDALELRNGNSNTVTHSFTNANDGQIDIDDALIIYTGLEPIADNLDAVDRVFNFPDTEDDITFNTGDDANDNILRIDSNNSEVVDFVEPSGSLTVNFGDGNDGFDFDLPIGKLPITNGGAGVDDEFVLLGAGQVLDLTNIADADFTEIATIDITGSGDNTLTLDLEEVQNLNTATDELRVRHNGGDTVNDGGGWTVDLPQVVDNQFLHVLTQDNATIEVVNTTPFLNPFLALDTNRSGQVSALDALIIVNRLNSTGSGVLPTPTAGGFTEFFYYDTNGDGSAAPVDVIRVVNFLNNPLNNTEGEGASVVPPVVTLSVNDSALPRRSGSIVDPLDEDNIAESVSSFVQSSLLRNRATDLRAGRESYRRESELDTEYAHALDELFSGDDSALWDEFFG